jgi:hypothetical protein
VLCGAVSEWTHLPYEALHTTATLWSNISSINVSSPKAQAFSHIRAALDDAWLGELAKSPAATQHIRELNLSGCSRITVQGLRHLKAFPHLRLILYSTAMLVRPQRVSCLLCLTSASAGSCV